MAPVGAIRQWVGELGLDASASAIAGQVSQPDLVVEVGDVWWLPEALARYPGGKDRFCLIVALEITCGGITARAHYVVGSTKRCGAPKIVLEEGEANLHERTHFGFWWSGDIDVGTLTELGRLRGRLDAGRLGEIACAIRTSRRVALRRLVR